MTPEEKIAELVEHIKKEFPKGCREVKNCDTCPVNQAKYGTAEESVCDMLAQLESRAD